MALEKVAFVPSKSITFVPDKTRQDQQLTITNNSDIPISFKMKTTRPKLFKMKPVFGLCDIGQKFVVKLVYMGANKDHGVKKDDELVNGMDRFSIVLMEAKDAKKQASKAYWTKNKSKIKETGLTKHKIKIVYKGLDGDKSTKSMKSKKSMKSSKSQKRKKKGAADAKNKFPPGNAGLLPSTPTATTPPCGAAPPPPYPEQPAPGTAPPPPVSVAPQVTNLVVMFRGPEPASASGSDSEDGEKNAGEKQDNQANPPNPPNAENPPDKPEEKQDN